MTNPKYSEAKHIIRKAMYEHQLVLFVGAGASAASGMPLWSEAVQIIADKMSMDASMTDSLVIPQYYYNARGRKEYTQLMRDIFKYGMELKTNEVHANIIRFNAETIITTNYDHLLEKAAEENGCFLQVISQNSELPLRNGEKELIKMHGDFEHNNFVLKEDDYLQYHKNFKLIENYIKSIIGTKTVLFIGYSLKDPDIKHIFSWVKDILNEGMQRAYLIEVKDRYDENQSAYYKNLGVNLIYSRELLGYDQEDESKIDLTRNLNETLEYFLTDEYTDRSLLDQIYYELKPFLGINYTYSKYIYNSFFKGKKPYNIFVHFDFENILSCYHDKASREELNVLEGIATVPDNPKANRKEKTIFNVLEKSCLQKIYYWDEKGEQQERVLKKENEDATLRK